MTMLRLTRFAFAVAVLALAGAAGIAGADVVASDQPAEIAAPDPAPVSGSESIDAHTPDPAGGEPWAVRTYRLASGQTCADFGRDVGGELGLIDAAGSFHGRRPRDAGGNCGDPEAAGALLLAATFYADDPTTDGQEPARTIVHGVAGSRVKTVSVEWPDGERQLELAVQGAFISVYPGGVERVPVTVGYRDGSSWTFDLKLKTG
jgi:hypothetical protein